MYLSSSSFASSLSRLYREKKIIHAVTPNPKAAPIKTPFNPEFELPTTEEFKDAWTKNAKFI